MLFEIFVFSKLTTSHVPIIVELKLIIKLAVEISYQFLKMMFHNCYKVKILAKNIFNGKFSCVSQ